MGNRQLLADFGAVNGVTKSWSANSREAIPGKARFIFLHKVTVTPRFHETPRHLMSHYPLGGHLKTLFISTSLKRMTIL